MDRLPSIDLTAPVSPRSVLRAFSTAAATSAPGAAQAAAAAPPAPERNVFGGLKDEDRIFTNIYGRHDPFLKVCDRPATPRCLSCVRSVLARMLDWCV